MSRPDYIREDVPLGPQTTLEVGGAARYFAACESVDQLRRVLQWSKERAHRLLAFGAGSNVLVADAGFDGVVVKYTGSELRFTNGGDSVEIDVDAGTGWDDFVQRCVNEKLAGIECLSGIPGLAGAAPIQNIGAYGQEVATSIVSVSGIDRQSLLEKTLAADACGFGYRSSRFKTQPDSFLVTSVRFRLARNDTGLVEYPDLHRIFGERQVSARPTLAQTRAAVISVRRSKSMVISPDDPNRRSAGSFFVNPVLSAPDFERLLTTKSAHGIAAEVPSFDIEGGYKKVPAAWLIEQTGFTRGAVDGQVGLSSRHALAIVNRGGATANDIVRFAARIRQAVKTAFGVTLTPEPVFVGFDTGADPFAVVE